MTSHRHSKQGHHNRVGDQLLLDVARDCVLTIGVSRTTLTEVARRAGVSRMTLYRRFPDARSLIAALMTREFSGLLSATPVAAPTARERLVGSVVEGVRALVANPIMRAVLDLEPELITPYVVQRLGSTQRLAEEYLRVEVMAGHADGSIRRADVPAQARALLLVVQSFVLSMRPASSDVDSEDLLAELAKILDGALEDR
ncbi:TetR/AcrR family transcriptional regulator [Actinocrispum wychmicini]|uniref:TetR family transcriptional regulator n=1 Tax=Actinocrispum wychmicini TaxID=1213861 RepID=A0A4R2JGP5_9PSEU|nr:TetR/AcrR family transcriptional regulator [Actinocrispum wychmicini]TCO58204.1 TetR family transcriptional regulator [Actinocrispum wychmicini]